MKNRNQINSQMILPLRNLILLKMITLSIPFKKKKKF